MAQPERPAHADAHADAAARLAAVAAEVGRAFIGSPDAVEVLLVALLARGHALIEGVPGVAKTTLARAFSRTIGASFGRIQFTPDLLPSDITGTFVFDMQKNAFVLRRGPIFAHVILADEINRAPAKTQSALLEAMQERQVTIEGETHPLDPPFLVLATQNPIEHEGTYPLPEAEMDRFLVKVALGYPGGESERRVLEVYSGEVEPVQPVLTAAEVLRLQALASDVRAERDVLDYILAITQRTRRDPRIALGASPRAALGLLWAAKARALLRGRAYALPDDVKQLAPAVLAHRIMLGPNAELDGLKESDVLTELLLEVPVLRKQ